MAVSRSTLLTLLCTCNTSYSMSDLTLIHVEEDVMSMFVVSIVLVFSGYNDGRPPGLSVLLQCHVELEQVASILQHRVRVRGRRVRVRRG